MYLWEPPSTGPQSPHLFREGDDKASADIPEPKCGAERGIDNRSQSLQVSKGLTQKTGLDPESALEKQASKQNGVGHLWRH